MSKPHISRYDGWLDAMLIVARHYGIGASEENLRVTAAWSEGANFAHIVSHMARQAGLVMRQFDGQDVRFDPWQLPMTVERDDGAIIVVNAVDGKGSLSVMFAGEKGVQRDLTMAELKGRVVRVVMFRPRSSVADARVDEYVKPYRPNWLWAIVTKEWRRYGDVMLASACVNLLALAGMIFSMQIYDRVIPAQSEPTLWVLFTGVMIALCFEFCLRLARSHVLDTVGKRADLKISDVVFGHAMRLKSEARSRSTGSFIAQIRELDQVREMLTSTTVSALADLPFVLLFVVVLAFVGGWLALVVLIVFPLLIIPGLLVQRPLANLSAEGMRESALRNAMLVEVVQGLDDIKLLRAEARFQNRWNMANLVSSNISMRQRFIVNALLTWTLEVQGLVYALVLVGGSYLVMKGDMTTGALVGTSILSSRMISPLAQVSGVFAKWQQAKVARNGLDDLMKKPVDNPDGAKMIHRASIKGDYALESVLYRYDEEARSPALQIAKLQIKAGEKVAVLGRIGSGKSTLLSLLAGLRYPQNGSIRLDGTEMSILDPADVRRDMFMLAQGARLFFGTIRENLVMGAPMADDEAIVEALKLSGAFGFVQERQKGLDDLIMEGGEGLSGGQRQSLLLARAMLCDPQIVLLDEPTSHFDDATERAVVDSLKKWSGLRTVVVATHRMAVLALVDRIVVVDGGRIVMDGPKEKILGALAR